MRQVRSSICLTTKNSRAVTYLDCYVVALGTTRGLVFQESIFSRLPAWKNSRAVTVSDYQVGVLGGTSHVASRSGGGDGEDGSGRCVRNLLHYNRLRRCVKSFRINNLESLFIRHPCSGVRQSL